MRIVDPGGTGARIESIYAYVVQHGPDDEAIAGMQTEIGWMPMVGSTDEAIKAMARAADMIAAQSGKPLMLVRFDRRTDIGRVNP